jgi:histidine ammonia-lyase
MVKLDGNSLGIQDLVHIARHGGKVELTPEGISAIERSHNALQSILNGDKAVYGINTGFGIFADKRIHNSETKMLSRNLILSHSVGTGPSLPEEIVKAAIVVRANTLAKGFSGARREVVDTLLAIVNKGVTPVIPSQGSLGSSGDLCLLSHLALVFSRDDKDENSDSGLALYNGKMMSGVEAMKAAGIPRIVLGAKEGLAVNNGATFSAALAALTIVDAENLAELADLALSLSLEALCGCRNAFDPRYHAARNFKGQQSVAAHVLEIIKGSDFLDSTGRVQDAYSLRCAPQVHGAARDTIEYVKTQIEYEINAATDNPLIFDGGQAISGGNFHGEPVGMAMDFLGIAVHKLAAISERRIFRLTDGKLNNGLPAMLVDSPEAAGLNSGLMMPQYTAASLVLENMTLATPDSAHSLPTSGEQEDLNANAWTAARHARQIVENAYKVIGIELYTACRAVDLRKRQMPGSMMGKGTGLFYNMLREFVPYQAGDAQWGIELEKIYALITNQEFLEKWKSEFSG